MKKSYLDQIGMKLSSNTTPVVFNLSTYCAVSTVVTSKGATVVVRSTGHPSPSLPNAIDLLSAQQPNKVSSQLIVGQFSLLGP